MVQFCYVRLYLGIECFLFSLVTYYEFSTEILKQQYPRHIAPLNPGVKNQDFIA